MRGCADGGVFGCLGCGGEAVLAFLALQAFLGGEVVAGELDGVENEAGAALVDGLVGNADGDFAEGLLDGVAVLGTGEVELVVGDDEADGWAVMLVVEAEILVVHGIASAAAVGFGPIVALVRFVWVTVGAVAVLHGVPLGSTRLEY